MNIRDLNPAAVALRRGEFLRLPHARGQRVEALDGELWITMDYDLRDIFVGSGEGFTIDTDGETLVSALRDSHVVVLS